MLAVLGMEEEKFAVDGIAERRAILLRTASQRVQEKFLALACVLEIPGLAAVARLVNAGLFAFPARHEVGAGGVEGHDSAKVERVSACHVQALPGLALIERFQNYAVGAGRPNGRHRHAFFTGSVSGTHAAQIGDGPARLNDLPSCPTRRSSDQVAQLAPAGPAS